MRARLSYKIILTPEAERSYGARWAWEERLSSKYFTLRCSHEAVSSSAEHYYLGRSHSRTTETAAVSFGLPVWVISMERNGIISSRLIQNFVWSRNLTIFCIQFMIKSWMDVCDDHSNIILSSHVSWDKFIEGKKYFPEGQTTKEAWSDVLQGKAIGSKMSFYSGTSAWCHRKQVNCNKEASFIWNCVRSSIVIAWNPGTAPSLCHINETSCNQSFISALKLIMPSNSWKALRENIF